jgi:hypothetical protein
VAVTLMIAPEGLSAQQPGAQEAVGAARALLSALSEGDVPRLRALSTPDARFIAVADSGPPNVSDLDSMVRLLEGGTRFVERMWDEDVRVAGRVAQVWAPYDLYRDGAWSHCGFDAFHLVREEGRWRVAAITYTVGQPPSCGSHPEGPPPLP